jgi:hypothetical protein
MYPSRLPSFRSVSPIRPKKATIQARIGDPKFDSPQHIAQESGFFRGCVVDCLSLIQGDSIKLVPHSPE